LKILLTGANGLVGSQINADIRLNGKKDLDLMDYEKVLSLFMDQKPDVIVHTAARVGGLFANMNYMSDFYYENIIINSNVLQAARIAGVKKVISFLSTCIFPESIKYPMREDDLHKGEPHKSNFGYSYAKRMLEVQSRAIRDEYNYDYTCVIPTNVYGPNDNFNLETSHVLPSLIHKCYLAKKDNKDFVVFGSGTPLREFIYSKDIGAIVEKLVYEKVLPDKVILSTSDEVSIKQLAEEIADKFNFKGNIIFDKSKEDGQLRKNTSNEVLKSIVGDFNFTKLSNGISETINWFENNYYNCRK
jgi:GDP-L-fucose synthase